MEKLRIGICGYGNLGKGIEENMSLFPNMTLEGIFTRRNKKDVKSLFNNKIYNFSELQNFKGKIDVLILSFGSGDLEYLAPLLAEDFNIVESFDNHESAESHFKSVDEKAKPKRKTAVVCAGWDPGLFSLARLLGRAFLPEGKSYTFWGRGVSQGHSEALRHIEGVRDALEYTVPNEKILEKALSGSEESFKKEDMHRRECFIALKKGADKEKIMREVKEKEGYFKGYETEFHFLPCEEISKMAEKKPHRGTVIRNSSMGSASEYLSSLTFSIETRANPVFTASILLSFAQACFKMNRSGEYGAKTIFHIKPIYFLPFEDEAFSLL